MESKVKDVEDFKFTKLTINRPLRLEYKDIHFDVKDVEDFKFTKLTINRPLRLEYKDIHFDETTAANYKEADKALLKEVAAYWEANMPGHVGFPDITFFLELKKAKIKVPQGKVALLRNYFGKRNPDMMGSVIFDELKKLEERESELMSKILG